MNRLFMATLVATCALGGQAFADEGMRGDGMRGGKMRHGAIMRMDTDKSGDVDRTEFTTAIATRAKERFDRLDTTATAGQRGGIFRDDRRPGRAPLCMARPRR